MRTALIGAVRSTQVALEVMTRLGHPPAAVVTLPLDKSSRHSDFVDLRPLAEQYGIPLIETLKVNDEDTMATLRALELDYLFVIGWSQLLGQALLSLPRGGSVGYHPAALPECRGRAVLPWTILLGMTETGSSLFWVDAGTDSGDLLGQERFAVALDETASTLYEKHMQALDRLMSKAILDLASGRRPATPQDHAQATYCAKRTQRDGLIDWNQPAEIIWRTIRAVGDPYPGAFTFHKGLPLVLLSGEWVPRAAYVGIPGQIQQLDERGALVLCGDGGFVRLTALRDHQGQEQPPASFLKVHQKLGLDLVALHEAALKGVGK